MNNDYSDLMFEFGSLVNYLDETEFQVDAYEADTYYLAECLIPFATKKTIVLAVNENYLMITAKDLENNTKRRTIYFPTKIEGKIISSTFSNGLLEVKIIKD
ncbi:Hsp20/alpha crystallin family protein [Niallia taxi]|uniref:Hsp20/alpha crystallin family protein n=1 Tax=Niallia taxi TaxID=2499688 RepID=A0A437K5B4_9BACI|nr:Hsp20/alpha crystallin family protein [Niallia taxi]RVT57966.1 Hsp20/alpha crystallin family protein [Niallia taxi]